VDIYFSIPFNKPRTTATGVGLSSTSDLPGIVASTCTWKMYVFSSKSFTPENRTENKTVTNPFILGDSVGDMGISNSNQIKN